MYLFTGLLSKWFFNFFQPENIVCVSKDTWDIKLIDFGLAKELKPGKTIKTMQGTPEFVGKFTMKTIKAYKN